MSKIFSSLNDIFYIIVPIGVVATAMIASLNIFLDRFTKQKRLEIEKLNQLHKTIRAKIADQQNEVAKEISEKLPRNLTAEDVDSKIASAVRSSFDTIASQSRDSIDFVSGLVNGYHQQALSQAKVQFWFSVITALIGFGYILMVAARASVDHLSGILNIVPGVVIDTVAFLFFRQAEQTRERATALYDRLRQDSQAEGTREMVNSIEDLQIRSLVKAQVALHMSGLTPKELDLQFAGQTKDEDT